MSKERTVFLRHILLCPDRIDRYTVDGKQALMRDAKTQDAVIRNLEIIGQAVKDLDPVRGKPRPSGRGRIARTP